MSNKYIVRQPIKDRDGRVLGNEILYYGANLPFSKDPDANEFAAADTIYNFLTHNGKKVLKGSLSFMTFTPMLLMKRTPKLFDKSELVIQIDDSVIIHPLSMHFVQQFAQEGYQIAVNEFQFTPRYLALLDSIDYIKINVGHTKSDAMRNTIEVAHSMNKSCIVTGIETEEQYQTAIAQEADALEGTYVAEKLTTKAHSSSYLQSNFFRLMVALSQDTPNVEEVEQLISLDAGLSYAVLKMANSVYFALRHRATTIHQAVMALGLGQLRQWVYLLSASSMDNEMEEGTEEFLKLSFMRANFCSELMKFAKDIPISRSDAYLMGMFSTLNHLIDAPMEEILAELPVTEDIKAALLRKEGRCGKLFALLLSYEAADWNSINTLAEELGIPSEVLTNVYFVCMENVNVLWEQLTSPYQAEETAQQTT